VDTSFDNHASLELLVFLQPVRVHLLEEKATKNLSNFGSDSREVDAYFKHVLPVFGRLKLLHAEGSNDIHGRSLVIQEKESISTAQSLEPPHIIEHLVDHPQDTEVDYGSIQGSKHLD